MTDEIEHPTQPTFIRVTIAAPLVMMNDANELASCLGYDKADRLTFTIAPTYCDTEGQLFRVASSIVEDAFLTDATAPLSEPTWGADLVAATRAQSTISLHVIGDDGDMTAQNNRITAIVGDDAQAAIAAMRLTRVEDDEGEPD